MIVKSVLTAGLGTVFLFLASACTSSGPATASAEDAADPRRGEKVNRICFNREIDSFSNASNKSVVLQASPTRHYLVETGSCFQLRRAQRIAIDGTTGCLTRGDRLIVSENIFPTSAGPDPDRCFVKAIYVWNEDAEAPEQGE